MATNTELLSLEEAKDTLRIQHNDDDHLIHGLITEAEGKMISYIGTPITKETFTEHFDGGGQYLFLEHFPVAPNSVTITDRDDPDDATDDETVDTDRYEVYDQQGYIARTDTSGGVSSDRVWSKKARRWKVEYDAGLNQHDGWDSWVERSLRNSIRDLVVFMYNNPEPGVRREQFSGGASKMTPVGEIPVRVLGVWNQFLGDLTAGP